MKISSFSKLLITLLPKSEPVLAIGRPGLGKSDAINAAITELGYDAIIAHPAVDDPTDYKGLPAATGSGTRATFLPYGNLERMIVADRPLVVFFDDLGQAIPAVQAPIMQLILAREVNGVKISPHVRFVAATNRREDKAGVSGMITPLLDRFTTVVNIDFDLDDWVRWGLNNNVPTELLSFVRFRPDSMNKFEATKDMRKSPTPRSVTGMGRLYSFGLTDYEILAGAVGEAFATEFIAFVRIWQKIPSIDEILNNPDTTNVPPDPASRYALMGMLAHNADEHNLTNIMRYLKRVPPEFSVLCAKDMIARRPDLQRTRTFIEWVMSNKAMFGYIAEEAGAKP
jgi:hypothetical protein